MSQRSIAHDDATPACGCATTPQIPPIPHSSSGNVRRGSWRSSNNCIPFSAQVRLCPSKCDHSVKERAGPRRREARRRVALPRCATRATPLAHRIGRPHWLLTTWAADRSTDDTARQRPFSLRSFSRCSARAARPKGTIPCLHFGLYMRQRRQARRGARRSPGVSAGAQQAPGLSKAPYPTPGGSKDGAIAMPRAPSRPRRRRPRRRSCRGS